SRAGRRTSTRSSTRCARSPRGPRASRSPPRPSPPTATGRTRLCRDPEVRSGLNPGGTRIKPFQRSSRSRSCARDRPWITYSRKPEQMSLYYLDDLTTIHHGGALDVLRAMPDESVHSIVTDPPYGLSNTDPRHVAETITRWVSGDREYVPSGRGFMGKEWDAFVPPVAVWDECLRVLKPGGHLLAFAGSRTADLMALAIRLA